MSETAKITKVVIAHGTDGDYYATAFAANGRAIWRSSEGYKNYTDLLSASMTSWPDAEYTHPHDD